MELIDTYAGNHPQPGYNESAELYRILGVFALVAISTVLLTFYELAVVRKELLVRLSMGESLARWIAPSILMDSGILLLAFIVSFLTLRLFTPIDPYLMLFSGLMVGLIVVNGLVYLRLRRLTIKEAFSNGQRSNKLLVFTYGMKFATAFLTILMLSSSITVIAEAVTIYKQRPFFEAKKNYSYTYIGHKVTSPHFSDEKSSDISERIQTELYTRFYDDFKVTLSTPVNSFTVDQPTVLMNRTAFNEVAGQFANSSSVLEHELTFFAPKGVAIPAKSTIDSGLRELGLVAYLADSYPVVRYQEDFETVAIDQNLTSGSTLIDDPLLIVVNEAKQPKAPKQLSNVLLADVMYDLDQGAFQDYVAEKQMTNELILQTNAWEKYLGIWEAAKRLMNMNLIFVVLILSLELLVIWTVLRLEYQVNAIELSVQKVMGYNIWQQNRRLVVSTMGITLVSTLAVALTAYILEFSSPGLLLAGGGLLLVAEGVLLIWLIRKIERANVQRILKGGGSMIEIRQLTESFQGKTLFESLLLTISQGDFVIFSGPSGCGKTTLLNMIGALEPIDTGTIIVDGKDITNKPNQLVYFRTKLGFLFQNFALVDQKTVRQNLEIVQKRYRSGKTIEEVLISVGLSDKINQKIFMLSGGEQQRVALARLMLKQCDIILADEPTGSLDQANAERVMALLQELNDQGKTIILVTHDEAIKQQRKRLVEIG